MRRIVLPLIASILVLGTLGFPEYARATVIDSDVTTGTSGSPVLGQSFNEIRAVDVTLLSSSNRMTESLTLAGLRLGRCDPSTCSALVGARIYDSATQALIASSNVAVPEGSNGVTVTISLSAILVSGQSYRIGFYVQTTPLDKASGDLFQPNAFPYVENSGIFRINSAYSFRSDSFPANLNIFAPQMTIRSHDITTQVAVSKFFTDSSLSPLPLDANGNPKVDVVLARGTVESTNPGQVIAWVNVTNTGSSSLQSLKLNETLPVDWTVHPPWMPAKGAIHVYYDNTASLATNLEITQPLTITVSAGNPEVVHVAIGSLNNTAIGHPLMPGQSILLSVKLTYGLIKTTQSAFSYPSNYADTASIAAWTLPSYTGTEASSTASAFFVAYAKVDGDPGGDNPIINVGNCAIV